MSLLKRLDEDLKVAMKESDHLKTSVIRMVKAALKNKQIDKGRELTEEDIITVISSLVKQGRESVEQFSKGEREDLAEKERKEISILQSYLPEQLTPEGLDRLIIEVIKEASAEGMRDMGKVMRILMPRVKGAADGKIVNQRVKELLEQA